MKLKCQEVDEKKYEQIRGELMTNEHLHELLDELEKKKPSLDGQIKTVSERRGTNLTRGQDVESRTN